MQKYQVVQGQHKVGRALFLGNPETFLIGNVLELSLRLCAFKFINQHLLSELLSFLQTLEEEKSDPVFETQSIPS